MQEEPSHDQKWDRRGCHYQIHEERQTEPEKEEDREEWTDLEEP